MALPLSRQCKHFNNFFSKRENYKRQKKLKATPTHRGLTLPGRVGTASWPHHTTPTQAQGKCRNQLPNPSKDPPKPKQDTKTSKTTAKGAREKNKNKKLTQNPPTSLLPCPPPLLPLKL